MDPLTREQAFQLLDGAPVAHIGLISDGAPYVTPMSFVLDGERILFRTKPGKKLDALRHDPRVCIEASQYDPGSGEWASVIVFGNATEADDSPTGSLTVELLYEKYSGVLGDPLSRGGFQPMAGLPHVFSVSIDEITGLSSGRGFTPRTRPGRL
jgi:hypothetical protein